MKKPKQELLQNMDFSLIIINLIYRNEINLMFLVLNYFFIDIYINIIKKMILIQIL